MLTSFSNDSSGTSLLHTHPQGEKNIEEKDAHKGEQRACKLKWNYFLVNGTTEKVSCTNFDIKTKVVFNRIGCRVSRFKIVFFIYFVSLYYMFINIFI